MLNQLLIAGRSIANQACVVSVLEQMHCVLALGEGVSQVAVGLECINECAHHSVEDDHGEWVTLVYSNLEGDLCRFPLLCADCCLEISV